MTTLSAPLAKASLGVGELYCFVTKLVFERKSVAFSSCSFFTDQPNFGSIASMSSSVALPLSLLRT